MTPSRNLGKTGVSPLPPGSGAVLSCADAPISTGSPFPAIVVMAKRADFLRAAQARRQGTAGFLLQARRRRDEEPATGIRIGYTCSKKVGNAVLRNRAKRRLREIARAVLPRLGQPGWDYVLVGRPGATVDRDFALMIADLERALASVHTERPRQTTAETPA